MHMHHSPNAEPLPQIAFDEFLRVDIRVGEVIAATALEGARTPSLRLTIDFGDPIGQKTSCAQLTQNYAPQDLIGKRVLCVVNFPPRQIAKTMSEVLTLGVPDASGAVVLVAPDAQTPLGGRLF